MEELVILHASRVMLDARHVLAQQQVLAIAVTHLPLVSTIT